MTQIFLHAKADGSQLSLPHGTRKQKKNSKKESNCEQKMCYAENEHEAVMIV